MTSKNNRKRKREESKQGKSPEKVVKVEVRKEVQNA